MEINRIKPGFNASKGLQLFKVFQSTIYQFHVINSTDSRVWINVNILNSKKMAQRAIKKTTAGIKVFVFHEAIIAYHCFNRNSKFVMEAVN